MTKNETRSPEGVIEANPRRPREWATAFVGFLAGIVGLGLSRLGLIWPDFDVFSQFTVQFLMWTLSFAIVSLFIRRLKSTAAIATTIIMMVLYGAWPTSREAQPALDQSLDMPHLRVAFHNIYKHNQDYVRISENLRAMQADAIVLAEVLPHHRPVLEALQSEFPHQISCQTFAMNCDVAILSRYPFAEQSQRLDGRLARVLSIAVRTPIGEVRLAAYHSSRFPQSRFQLKQANDVVQATERLTRPLVLAGDFNATPHSRSVNIIAENADLSLLNNLPTWPATYHLPQLAIDHIMISKELVAVTSIGVSDSGGSDHLPLIVTLTRAALIGSEQ